MYNNLKQTVKVEADVDDWNSNQTITIDNYNWTTY